MHSTHAFAEKVALVTDGTGPIGRAVALQLALNGAFVIIGIPKHVASEEAYVSELTELGTLFHIVGWDPSAENASEQLFEQACILFGRIDLLINCTVSTVHPSRIQMSVALDDANLESPINEYSAIVDRFAELMAQRPKPKIVNIFSIPVPGSTADHDPADLLEKELVNATNSMANRSPAKFRLNSLIVGSWYSAGYEMPNQLEPTHAKPPADDIARVVLFLLSGESTAINGQVIRLG